jgi:hypothetical protein
MYLLEPLQEIKTWSELLKGDNNPTIQFVIPALVQLCNFTKAEGFDKCRSKATEIFCRQFESEIKSRISEYGRKSPQWVIANFLHPCFKGTALNKDNNKTYMHQTKMWIINKYTDNDEEEVHDESTSQSILTENTPQEQVPEKSSKWSY